MADKTGISWTDKTWNPTTGCTKLSAGCDNCYASDLADKLQRQGMAKYANGFSLTLHPQTLDQPRRWRQGSIIFVNSMSDLFHRDVPDDYLVKTWDAMLAAPQHIYQVLTKRTHRMAHKIRTLGLRTPGNIWLGTSVENQSMGDSRIPALLDTPALVKFLSVEPLLEDIDVEQYLAPKAINWVIVGGESGLVHRPMDEAWARNLRDQCQRSDVAYYLKQFGGRLPSKVPPMLDGQQWHQFPDVRGLPTEARPV